MSNRILWILILLWFLFFWIVFYLYFFIYYKGIIVINSNVKNYKVELYANRIVKTFNFDCPVKRCILDDISPFNYNFKIKKQWYETFEENIKISRNDNFHINVNLKKKINLRKIELKTKKQTLSNEKEIELIKKKNFYYAFFDLKDGKQFYFIEKNWKITLFHLEKDLVSFDLVPSNDLSLKKVYGDKDSIFIKVWNKKYIYNLSNNSLQEVDLFIDVIYVKYWKNNYLLATSKGNFIYDIKTNKLEYFSLFKDFIYFDDYYIWLVKSSETRIMKNLWLEHWWDFNTVISYNPFSKQKKILYETQINFDKIINDNWKVLLVSNFWESYVLENF